MGPYELRYLKKVLDCGFPNEGEMASEFESKVARLCKAREALAVTSGTAAISLALRACGVGPGDEVIVPDLTFIATANAAHMWGAKPVLVDVEPKSLNMDPAALEAAITRRTKAIVPVHVSGRGADMEAILEVAGRHGIDVVEDAAEGFMSKRSGRYLGTFGRFGALSFSPNKIITTGQGGIILAKTEEDRIMLRELKDQGRPVRGTGGDDVHDVIGYNFKFTDLQAAVGLGQLKYLGQRMKRMKRIGSIYRKELSGVQGIRVFDADLKGGELPLWTDALVDDRGRLEAELKSRGMDCRRFWHPLHTQRPYARADSLLPVSSRLGPKALWLPSAFSLTDRDVSDVCGAIRRFE
jgi:perosamine synthetase